MSNTEAMRRYRSNPENRAREQQINACRAAALVQLAQLHQDEYEALCNSEREAAGLPLLGERKGRPPKVTPISKAPTRKSAARRAKPARTRRSA